MQTIQIKNKKTINSLYHKYWIHINTVTMTISQVYLFIYILFNNICYLYILIVI